MRWMLCLLIAATAVAQDQKDPVKECATNLRQLWMLETVYRVQFGGKEKRMPDATGPAFWLALAKTEPPLLEAGELGVLVCPLSKEKPRADFTTYRGPSKNVAELDAGAVVGCCRHGEKVLTLCKNGDVQVLAADDPAAKAAVEATVGAPKKP